jgi:large subunit ribosomal protein L24
MAGLFVKKGDTVQVIAGKDAHRDGKPVKGEVISVDVENERVLVAGVNSVTRHTKVSQSPRGSQQGGIVHQEAPVHVSNVQVICPNCNKPSRIGHRRSEADANGKTRTVRICRRCDGDI